MAVSDAIRDVETDVDILRCHGTMRQLRPDHDPGRFLAQVRRQQRDGYRLAMLDHEGTVVAVAGYRISENLAWGRFLYVDDLVTDTGARSLGHGRRLLEWLVSAAREAGCRELHLDSGVQREDAHRFYLREGLDLTSHHFRVVLGDR